MIRGIVSHYRGYLAKRPWTFCWHAGLEGAAISIVLALLLTPFLGSEAEEEAFAGLLSMPPAAVFFIIVIATPIAETLVLQSFPVYLARRYRRGLFIQFLAGAVPFALIHLPNGPGSFIAAGIVGGAYFSFGYVHFRRRSRWTPLWTTIGQHAIHNFIAFLLLVVSGELGG